MKQHTFIALRLTLVCLVCFAGLYTLLILGMAKASPGKGEGEKVVVHGSVVGYALEGQGFTQDKYFYSRPSAVDYNGAGSGGSNKGTSNPAYLAQVQGRIDSFLAHNPGVAAANIPAELVTASGSGLDPDLSVAAASIQVKRIAHVRNITEEKINKLVHQAVQPPLLGLFGTERINVLKLNIALDELK